MTEVVYADILVIVNTYVNYALLRLTGILCRKDTNRLRIALTAFFGSFYSFIILADFLPSVVIAFSRLAFAALLIVAAFKINSKRDFLRLFGIFFALNFAFAGLMFAIHYFIAPNKMVYNNGIVYFNIDAMTLAILTIICYLTIKLIHKFAVFKSPINTLYEIEFNCFGYLFSCRAFLDTGNSLKEPFSSLPVIVAYENLSSKNDNNITLKMLGQQNEDKSRLIPCAAVSSSSVLKAYKITDVHIKGIDIDFTCNELYAALIGRKIHGGDFGILLSPEVFKSNTKETEGDYV